ncbi:MAG: MBL fold metallo-hydrolase [Thiotrichaceae bacterium]|nr:MBL fold metallo-hydrolase [Thiotrichaceae bacterium]
MSLVRLFFICIVCLVSWQAQAVTALEIQKVSSNVYALVGELDQRSKDNLANNATFGVIVTAEGVILIDSGGSYLGARKIDQAIQKITDQPVKIVINSGGQDHKWLGNGYFKAKGASIISSRQAVADHRKRTSSQLNTLDRLLGEKLDGTVPVYADEVFEREMDVKLGNVKRELFHVGAAHTVGDLFVWMPDQKIMFSGDIVFTERMLGPGPAQDSASWMRVFELMMNYKPEIVIPGHGHAGNNERAWADTYNYIKYMRGEVSKILAQDGDIQDAINIDQSRFKYLKVYERMARRSAQSFFSHMEFE